MIEEEEKRKHLIKIILKETWEFVAVYSKH